MKRVTGFNRLDLRTLSVLVGAVVLAASTCISPAGAQEAQNTQAPSQSSFPKWSEFPVAPKNVPTPADFAQRVQMQSVQAQALKTEVAAIVWDTGTAEDLAAKSKGRLNPVFMKPVDQAMSQADIEALAASLRKRATPPPIVH